MNKVIPGQVSEPYWCQICDTPLENGVCPTCKEKEMIGQCKVVIQFGDDHGDNVCTFECGLEEGHKGRHKEEGDQSHREEEGYTQPYTLEWEDEHKEEEE